MTVNAGQFNGFDAPPDASISVFNTGTEVLASLYTDYISGSAAPNPLTADFEGNFSFFAAPGYYDVVYDSANESVAVRFTVTVRADYQVKGACGTAGACGISGTAGVCGVSGTAGACGVSGVAGACGLTGACGLA
jgi:hypothetical protein